MQLDCNGCHVMHILPQNSDQYKENRSDVSFSPILIYLYLFFSATLVTL